MSYRYDSSPKAKGHKNLFWWLSALIACMALTGTVLASTFTPLAPEPQPAGAAAVMEQVQQPELPREWRWQRSAVRFEGVVRAAPAARSVSVDQMYRSLRSRAF